MFCIQCEQTRRTGPVPGCTTDRGTCGKQPETSDLQDLLLHAVQGVSQYAVRCRALGVQDRQASELVLHAVFATLTNVNFDDERIIALIRQAAAARDRLRAAYRAAARTAGDSVGTVLLPPLAVANWVVPVSMSLAPMFKRTLPSS